MKNIFLLIMLFTISLLIAQPIEANLWLNMRHSAVNQENNVILRMETADIPLIDSSVWYSTSNGWQQANFENISELTIQSSIPFEGQDINCRIKSEGDEFIALMPALVNDVLPQSTSTLAHVASDEIGDFIMEGNNNTDLTNFYFGYSDNKMHTIIENSEGNYPFNSGGIFPSEYYFYLTILGNPESALIDSVVFAAVYGQVGIPGILGISPGIYKVDASILESGNFSLESFSYVADIQSQVSDGLLNISFDIEDLTSDESFGEWPNSFNSLIITPITITVNTSLDPQINDMTKIAIMNFDQYIIPNEENILPELTNLIVQPYEENQLIVRVNYFDSNNHFPLFSV